MKSCFEELHTFLSMRGDISFSEVRTQEGEFKRITMQPKDFTVEEITSFDGNLCSYQLVIGFLFLFSLVWEKCF